ncbi:MAG: fibronectin type III domain-containing protein [Chloroflexota bacterium]
MHTVEAHRAGTLASLSLYISPSGNDSNPGTRSRPFRSIGHARDVVRTHNTSMTRDITVYLRSGTYQLSRSLQLSSRDSGSNGHTITWRAAPGENAVISGAMRITNWRLSDPSRNLWSADIPRDLQTRQLYVNGMRASLPSGPAPVTLVRTATGYTASSAIMAQWRNPSDITFVYTAQLGLMVEPICPVGSISGTSITMAQPCWDNSTMRRHNLVGFGTLDVPSYIENAYELLDQPGQFYLDRSAHSLFYLPRPGQIMATADVEAPVLQTLIKAAGTSSTPIHNVAFSNLQFSYATWMQPGTPEGFSEVQSNFTITGKHGYETQGLCHFAPHGTCPYGTWTREPAGVEISFDRSLSFRNDRFVHLGAAGLDLDNGSQDAMVIGSVFTDISGNGLEIGNVNMPKARGAFQTRGITVTDNHLYGFPVEYHGGVAILVGYAAKTTISHNQIDHTSYTPISMGWGGWPDKKRRQPVANFSHDNLVSDNLIYDFMQMLADGGGIYTLGITGPSLAHGQKVSGNVIHDQLVWSYALHSDNGAGFITYSRNAMYNNNYDYCCNHYDYVTINGGYDPQLIQGNYWQQGDPNSSGKAVREAENTVITGPKQVPVSILAHAGIERRYISILKWRWSGESAPGSPDRVTVLYAFRGKAYVGWTPSFAEGNDPVVSYVVRSRYSNLAPDRAPYRRPSTTSVRVSAAEYKRRGYAVVRGLTNGLKYTFTVTAATRRQSSLTSIPSAETTVRADPPARPGRPASLRVQPAKEAVSVIWYAPKSSHCTGHWYAQTCLRPVLAFNVTVSDGRKFTLTGLSQLIVSNASGRALRVIGGLQRGRQYRFSVSAMTPAGAGPPLTSDAVSPQ